MQKIKFCSIFTNTLINQPLFCTHLTQQPQKNCMQRYLQRELSSQRIRMSHSLSMKFKQDFISLQIRFVLCSEKSLFLQKSMNEYVVSHNFSVLLCQNKETFTDKNNTHQLKKLHKFPIQVTYTQILKIEFCSKFTSTSIKQTFFIHTSFSTQSKIYPGQFVEQTTLNK